MSCRSRTLWFSSCAVLVAAGVLCAVLVPGTTGDVLGLTLVSLGLVAATLLVFLEVGLSEDRERAREAEARRRQRPQLPRRRSTRRPRRPG